MKMGLSAAEGMVLHGLLEETAGDIVIKLDGQGFLKQASANFTELGFDLSHLLLFPHVADLAQYSHATALSDYASDVLTGHGLGGWLEFPVANRSDPDASMQGQGIRWYAISLKPTFDSDGDVCGAIGLLRSVEHRRALEGELHASVLTDPHTGLANRRAFCATMQRYLADAGEHSLAILAVDRMRAILLQYGQRAADEIQWGFARFLESMILPGQELAQLDAERFAVIMPGIKQSAAGEWARDVLKTFSSLTDSTGPKSPKLSASAGVASIEGTVDWTQRQAELALVMARARGGMQLGMADALWTGDRNKSAPADRQLGVRAASR